MLLWGWGQIASGDRRGWLGPPAQAGLLAGMVWVTPQLAPGTGVGILFLLGTLLLAAWAAVPMHAYRQAAGRQAAVGRAMPGVPGPGSGIALLLLAPAAIVASSLFWSFSGRSAEPAAVLDWYVTAWQEGRAADATVHLRPAPSTEDLLEVWERQETALRNELVRLAAQEGPGAGIDPGEPLGTVRWVDAGATSGGGRLVLIEVARRETVRGLFLGFLPASTQSLVTLAGLGQVELQREPIEGPLPPGPWAEAWRITGIEVAGAALGEPVTPTAE
jgi:hypothetical protein